MVYKPTTRPGECNSMVECLSRALVTFLIAVSKHLIQSDLREQGFILAHSLKRWCPSWKERHSCWSGRWMVTLYLQSRNGVSRKWGLLLNLKAHPRDPLPPASLYLPKLLRPSEVGPAVEDQVLDA